MIHNLRVHRVVGGVAGLPNSRVVGDVVGLAQDIAEEDVAMGIDAAGNPARQESLRADEAVPGDVDWTGKYEPSGGGRRAPVGRVADLSAGRRACDAERKGRVIESAVHAELRVGD